MQDARIFQNLFKTNGFAGAIPGYPLLVGTCDGVGTKHLIEGMPARTIGIDCVAMNINDLLAAGALPAAFFNYVACGDKSDDYLVELGFGIKDALGECSCPGGETSIAPELSFDVVGFALGTRQYFCSEPKLGDLLVGLPSSGIHSNGFTYIRNVMGSDWCRKHLGWLSRPTRIYTREFKQLMGAGIPISLLAHITGGGLVENITRQLPAELELGIELWNRWERDVRWFQLPEDPAMFNLGIGFVFAVSESDIDSLPVGMGHQVIGRIVEK